jgi:hypothetical protein
MLRRQTTGRNIPEDSNLHTRRRENLKSYKFTYCSLRTVLEFGIHIPRRRIDLLREECC